MAFNRICRSLPDTGFQRWRHRVDMRTELERKLGFLWVKVRLT
jgi:hypothetical protein